MSEPSTSTTAEPVDVVIVHGGPHPVRAVVLDTDGRVITTTLLPQDHDELDEQQRYDPGEGLSLRLLRDNESAGPGYRFADGRFTPPDPPAAQPELAPAATPQAASTYGRVVGVDPLAVDLDGQQVQPGRLAGYTPEVGHLVKLSRMGDGWIVDDRVFLATEAN